MNYFLAALSGLLLALSFPYPSIQIFAWIGLVPLFFAVQRSNFKSAPVLGLTFGVVFFATVLYWVRIFGVIAWVALSLMLSLWIVLFAVGLWLVLKNFNGAMRFILIPSLWVLCEYGKSLGSWGFAWANIGSTVDNLTLLRVASYSGELGLGFVIVAANLVLFHVLRKDPFSWKSKIVAKGLLVLAVFVFLWPVAELLMRDSQKEPGHGSLKLAIVQPGIAQGLKADISNNNMIKAKYLRMTKEALESKPDLIAWPESVFISYVKDEEDYLRRIKELLVSADASLIFGSLDSVDNQVHNSAFYIDQFGKRHVYRKIHLVPFGEYVPMRGLVERINNMAALVNDQTPGREYKVFDLKLGDKRGNAKFSTIICFESSDSALVAKMVRAGARMIVVVTNDGWFGKTAAPEQHFRITRMRAVESGIPVVQSANTGISGIINSDGRVAARTGLDNQQLLYGTIAFASRPSFYSQNGYLMPYFYLGVILSAIGYKVFSRFRWFKSG